MANKRVEESELINCLRNEKIIVRHIPKTVNKVTNPKHVLYGGMSESAVKTFVVPKLSSGRFVNVLTNDEMAFLESTMGYEPGTFSIYKKEHNFWDDSQKDTISKVTLKKQDNYLDLSDPSDYIKYKILLANKDLVAPSLDALEKYPKATYQYVLIGDGEDIDQAKSNMTYTMMCYKEYGKVEENADILKLIIEIIEGRPVANSSKLPFLQTKVNDLIQNNPKRFLKVVTDKMLPTKVLIRKAIQAGTIVKKGDYLYLRSDGSPLCNEDQEPTIEIAARFLNEPRHQTIKFSLEAESNKE